MGIAICSTITKEEKITFQQLMDDADLKKKELKKPKDVSLPLSSIPSNSLEVCNNTTNTFSNLQKDPKKRKRPLEEAFNLRQRDELHAEIARMFYTAGLSFNLARNPHYIRAFSLATSNTVPGYTPPGYNSLQTTLLARERKNISILLEPIKASWQTKGVSICSDGWTDPQRKPLINIMDVCESGHMFLKAVNCEGEYKDKYFISKLLIEAINEVGHQNVVQVCTDNAPVCKGAGLLVEAKYPHIFWTPYVVHTLNLALKNICEPSSIARNKEAYEQCHWIAEVYAEAMMIKHYIMNHNMRLSMFRSHSELTLLSVADTRFASVIIMLKRFRKIKKNLEAMVINDMWELYKDDDVSKAMKVKYKILDGSFWEKIDYILSFTSPIYEMLRMADTDKPCLHLIYEWWDDMISNVRIAITSQNVEHLGVNIERSKLYKVVVNILMERWSKSNTPLHSLEHSLNPRYYSNEWLQKSPTRLPPHRDIEISRERKKCIERYYSDSTVRRNVNEEFASFSAVIEDFSCHDSLRDRGLMSATKWWAVHGSSTPTLQLLAFKLIGQPCSSSCCERNWSTYTFIKNLKRNKIVPQRAEDLVYVHSNLRLLSRSTPQYNNEGVNKMWDVGADAFDSLTLDIAPVLEIANLSLDELEFEGVLFDGNDGRRDEEMLV